MEPCITMRGLNIREVADIFRNLKIEIPNKIGFNGFRKDLNSGAVLEVDESLVNKGQYYLAIAGTFQPFVSLISLPPKSPHRMELERNFTFCLYRQGYVWTRFEDGHTYSRRYRENMEGFHIFSQEWEDALSTLDDWYLGVNDEPVSDEDWGRFVSERNEWRQQQEDDKELLRFMEQDNSSKKKIVLDGVLVVYDTMYDLGLICDPFADESHSDQISKMPQNVKNALLEHYRQEG